MIPVFLLAALASYQCEAGAPQRLDVQNGAAKVIALGLPPEMNARQFSISLSERRSLRASLAWPGDPMQMSGDFPALSIGGGAYAFTTVSGGPCLFTETACLSQVTLVDTGGDTAKVVIIPSSIAYVDATKQARMPFLVVIQGDCRRTGTSK